MNIEMERTPTTVSVTYGVGTHARGGSCDAVWLDSRLNPNLEHLEEATSPGVQGKAAFKRNGGIIMYVWSR